MSQEERDLLKRSICDTIASTGMPLAWVCAQLQVKSRTVRDWKVADEVFAANILAAVEEGEQVKLALAVEAQKKLILGYEVTETKQESGENGLGAYSSTTITTKVIHPNPQLILATLKAYDGKYKDRIDLTSDNKPIATVAPTFILEVTNPKSLQNASGSPDSTEPTED